jgi:hypothetical protein
MQEWFETFIYFIKCLWYFDIMFILICILALAEWREERKEGRKTMSLDVNLSRNLKKEMKYQKVTIVELSKISGVSKNKISNIRIIKQSTSLAIIEKLAIALNADPINLIREEK